MTVSLADLPKGHEFAETRFELTPEWVAEYRAAVEDESSDPSNITTAIARYSVDPGPVRPGSSTRRRDPRIARDERLAGQAIDPRCRSEGTHCESW